MAFVKWLAFMLLDWIAMRLIPLLSNLYKRKKAEDKDQLDNEQAVSNLEDAKTEEERRKANEDLTRTL